MSKTVTSAPRRASARPTASPTSPAPTTPTLVTIPMLVGAGGGPAGQPSRKDRPSGRVCEDGPTASRYVPGATAHACAVVLQ